MSDASDALVNALVPLSIHDLREMRNTAAASGDAVTANACHAAIERGAKIQRPEHATCGELFAHSYRDDVGRKITTYTGDFMAAFSPFMRPGASGKLNLELREEALSGKLTSVRVPAGHKLALVKE